MTFSADAPEYMKWKYQMYLKKLKEDAASSLSFYDRQQIDGLVKAGKEIMQK